MFFLISSPQFRLNTDEPVASHATRGLRFLVSTADHLQSSLPSFSSPTCRPLRSRRPSWASRRCWTPAMWLARSPTTWASSPTSPGTTATSTGSLTVGTVTAPRRAKIRSQTFSKLERGTLMKTHCATMQHPLQGEPRPHVQSVHICEMSVQSVSNYPKSCLEIYHFCNTFSIACLKARSLGIRPSLVMSQRTVLPGPASRFHPSLSTKAVLSSFFFSRSNNYLFKLLLRSCG